MNVKKAFEQGFINRALNYGYSIADANAFTKSANFSSSLSEMGSKLYPHTSDSLFDVALKNSENSHSTSHEWLEILKHMGKHGLAPGVAGAGAGALTGLATSKKEDNKLHKVRNGALWGGALGFGSGALTDAYRMGDNTKDDLVNGYEEEKSHIPNDLTNKTEIDRLNNNIDSLKHTNAFGFFVPPYIDSKLK